MTIDRSSVEHTDLQTARADVHDEEVHGILSSKAWDAESMRHGQGERDGMTDLAANVSKVRGGGRVDPARRYFRAANYLTAGQIYLMDNPLLRRLSSPRTSNRVCSVTGEPARAQLLLRPSEPGIKAQELSALFVCGPGHGGPAVVANTWLEGTYSERFPHIERNAEGMARLFRQFSFPGGIPSHCSPGTPGSSTRGVSSDTR